MVKTKAQINPITAFKQWHPKVWGYHLLFWLLLAILLTTFGDHPNSLSWAILLEVFNLSFYAAVVYYNVFYLIPKFLSQKKFGVYIGYLLSIVVVVTMLKVVVFSMIHTGLDRDIWIVNQGYIFLAFFMVVVVSTIAKISVDWVTYQREKQEIITKNVTSELRFLRSQINPHFLFNTLNSLYALTLKKSDIAPEIVLKLSEMMRYMLYECNEKTVLLANEVNYIKNYLDLERLRHGDHVDIQFKLTGEIKGQRIAPLFFIPFLENSFKHGLNHELVDGFVYIDLEVEENSVHLNIKNSKPEAMPLAASKRSSGFGLANVRQRLNMIYPDKHELKVMVGPQAYHMDLRIKF